MDSCSWEEIKRLASDFKQAQLSSTAQNISERNCVEIVNRLVKLGLIEVYHTCDGKSYVTPDMVVKEIYDELQLHHGRVNLVDLQQAINIDFSYIEAKVHELVRNDSSLELVLGQLISRDYLTNVCREVNDLLNEQGHLRLSDIIKQYDLPTKFMRTEVVEAGLKNGLIKANFVEENLFTEAYVARHKARIRGYLTAVIRPIALNNVIHALNIPTNLFNSLLDEMIAENRLKGSVTSGHANFVPECYAKVQTSWVDNFFSQNNYVEFSQLKRNVNVANPRQFITKKFPSAVLLNTCAVHENLINQLTASVEEGVHSESWIDLSASLPPCCDSSDIQVVVQPLLKRHHNAQVLGETVFVSPGCFDRCRRLFDPLMAEQAVKDIRKNPALLASLTSQPDRLANAPSSTPPEAKGGKGGKKIKSGGGDRGREIKTKNVKKKYLAGKGTSVEESADPSLVPFMSEKEIREMLEPALGEDAPEELLEEMAEQLHPVLLRSYQDVVRSAFVQTSGTARKRSSHGNLTEKLQRMSQHLALAEKALEAFCAAGDDFGALRPALLKHLAKSLGTEMADEIFRFAAEDFNFEEWPQPDKSGASTPELRQKLLAFVTDEKLQRCLRDLSAAVQRADLEQLQNGLERSTECLNVMLKKADKKREKTLALEIAAQLCSDLDAMELEPPLLLLTTCCLLFQGASGLPLNVPGRNVPNVIAWLKTRVPAEVHEDLGAYQSLVVQKLKMAAGDEPDKELGSLLEELTPKIKGYAESWKKIKYTEGN